jgi:hypothetical protein
MEKSEEVMKVIRHNRAVMYAGKFLADHRENDDTVDNMRFTSGINDLSDEHLAETFKNCVTPLSPAYYEDCRTEIKNMLTV